MKESFKTEKKAREFLDSLSVEKKEIYGIGKKMPRRPDEIGVILVDDFVVEWDETEFED